MNLIPRSKATANAPVIFPHIYTAYNQSYPPYNLEWPLPNNVMQGESIPNFFALKKAGVLLPHTAFFQREVLSATAQGINAHAVSKSNAGVWYDMVEHTLYPPAIEIKDAVDLSAGGQHVQAAAAAIANNGFDAGTALAELASTKRLLENASKRLGGLLKRKGSWLTPEQLHNAWLEGRYGWRPLAYDIRDLNEAVREFDDKREIWTERSGHNYAVETEGSHQPFYNTVFGTVTMTYVARTKHSVRGSVSALFRPARFIVDPLQTGWELVPFSFVVDWALGVGQAISAYRLIRGASGTTSSIGHESVTKVTGMLTEHSPHASYNTTVSGGTYEFEIRETRRQGASISTTPILKSDKPLNPLNSLDLQALHRAKQTLSSKKGRFTKWGVRY